MKQHKLNIGCGSDYRKGFVNIDRGIARCDLTLDLEDAKLPFDDNSVDYILASHVLEHINNLIGQIGRAHV